MISASLAMAISRLRSWDRSSDAVTVMEPPMSLRPRRLRSNCRCSSVRVVDPATFHVNSARLSVVLTCWPPGPDERENRQLSSAAGIVSDGGISRSMDQALHVTDVQSGAIAVTFAGTVPVSR